MLCVLFFESMDWNVCLYIVIFARREGGGGRRVMQCVSVLKHCRGRSEFHVIVVHWLLSGSGSHQDSCQYILRVSLSGTFFLEGGGRKPVLGFLVLPVSELVSVLSDWVRVTCSYRYAYLAFSVALSPCWSCLSTNACTFSIVFILN